MRHIWVGPIALPDGTLAELLVNVFNIGNDDMNVEAALRPDSYATWGMPAVLAYEGSDPPSEVAP